MSRTKENLKGIALLLTSILASAAAQLLLKAGMNSLRTQIAGVGSVLEFIAQVSVAGWVLGGLACYAISLLAWLGVLSRFALSLAYPLLSMSYIIVFLGAAAWPRLAEPLSIDRLIGILFVIAGVVLVAASGRDSRGGRSVVTVD